MPANALALSVLFVLVLTAAAARVAVGPIAGVAGKGGAYALAKIGSRRASWPSGWNWRAATCGPATSHTRRRPRVMVANGA